MPNDITVTKNTTSGSERWDITYTADQAGTIDKTLLTAGKLMDRNEKVSITIPSGSATTPATTITPNNITISVNSSTGLITASNTQKTQSVTPTVSAGYVSSGTAGTITVSAKSATSQLSTQAGTTISPTESEQTAVAANKYTLGAVKVGAISSTYVGSGITQRDSDDLTVSGATVTAPAGYYASSASKSVASMTLPTSASSTSSGTSKATISRSTSDQYINIPTGYNGTAAYYKVSATPNGSATTPATTIYSIPTMSIDSATGIVSAVNNESQSVTPTVSAGYVSSGTAGTITVSGGASMSLSTQAAKTVTPTTSNQTAVAAGKYTLGAVTVAGDANLIPANIVDGVTIFGVTGTHQGGGAIISTTQDSHGGEILTITTTGNVSYLQSKTVTPTSSVQIITPDSGYDGLSEVIVNAAQLEEPQIPLYINLVPLKTVSSGGNLEPYAVTNWFRTYRSSVLRALVDDKEEFLIPQYLPAGGGDFVAGRQAWCGDTVQIEFDELEFSYVYFTGSGTHTIQIDAIEKFKALTRSQTVTTSSNGGHPNGGICAQLISAWDEKPYIYSISQIPSKLYVVVSNNGVNTTYVLPSSLYQGYYGWGELNGDEEPDFTNFPVYIAFGNLNGNSGELYVFTETTSTITILTAIPEYMSASGVYF